MLKPVAVALLCSVATLLTIARYGLPGPLANYAQSIYAKTDLAWLDQSKTQAVIKFASQRNLDWSKGAIVFEFDDPECEYCRLIEPDVQLLRGSLGSRIVSLDFPLAGHTHAAFASAAELVAQEKGLYEPLHSLLLRSNDLSRQEVLKLAGEIGLDPKFVEKESTSRNITSQIAENEQFGNDIGIVGTPSFVVLRTEGSAVLCRTIPQVKAAIN